MATTGDTEMQHLIEHYRAFGDAVCGKIAEAIAKLGLSLASCPPLPQFVKADFQRVTDPYSQSQDLVGYWYDANLQRIGQIRFYGDGSFYAEYDVVQPHPAKKQWFVEAINAWGREGAIKTEAKLLEMPPA